MCVRVYVCVDLYLPLSVCDKSLSDPVQDTQCLNPLQPTKDKFIYKWCADNGSISLTLLPQTAQSDPAMSVFYWQMGISQKKKKLLEADQDWV